MFRIKWIMIITSPGHMHARLIIKSSRCIECSIHALVKTVTSYNTAWNFMVLGMLFNFYCILYSGKFSHGAKFRVFRGLVSYRENKNREILNNFTRACIHMPVCDRASASLARPASLSART